MKGKNYSVDISENKLRCVWHMLLTSSFYILLKLVNVCWPCTEDPGVQLTLAILGCAA